ncbi:outer-membrane lipoprotein carrier protein precursor [bacterium BMS3Bbin09]|nr:outer-membrane lipoprotein carrier protein precursor [bacterium BMS3Bbin09]
MKKKLSSKTILSSFVFLTLIVLFISAVTANAATLDETVEMIQKKFETIKDIKGSFSQTSYIKDLEETQEFSGTFFLIKPSHMMWEYNKPRDEKVVINDTETWIYKKSQNQVIKTTFSKESYSQVPIAILQSFENIRDDFDITMPEESALQLIPKQKLGFIKTLVLETKTDGFPIKMFTIIDTYGNIIMIEIKQIKTNSGLDASIFIFKVPQGAEVFDMSR